MGVLYKVTLLSQSESSILQLMTVYALTNSGYEVLRTIKLQHDVSSSISSQKQAHSSEKGDRYDLTLYFLVYLIKFIRTGPAR